MCVGWWFVFVDGDEIFFFFFQIVTLRTHANSKYVHIVSICFEHTLTEKDKSIGR